MEKVVILSNQPRTSAVISERNRSVASVDRLPKLNEISMMPGFGSRTTEATKQPKHSLFLRSASEESRVVRDTGSFVNEILRKLRMTCDVIPGGDPESMKLDVHLM